MLVYSSSEWVVRRWDWFHRGKHVAPRSFCHFWRTVLFWATLAAVLPRIRPPLVEKVKPAKAPYVEPPPIVWAPWAVVVGRVVWKLILPLRFVLGGLWAGGAAVVEFFEDRPRQRERLGKGFVAVLVIAMAAVFFYAIGGAVLWLITVGFPWLFEQPPLMVLLYGAAGFGATIACALALLALLIFLAFVWNELLPLLWDIALTGKRKVCPPMAIVRPLEAAPLD